MFAQKYAPIHLVDVKIFSWVSEKIDLLVVLQEKSGDHQCRYALSSGNNVNLCKITWQSIQ